MKKCMRSTWALMSDDTTALRTPPILRFLHQTSVSTWRNVGPVLTRRSTPMLMRAAAQLSLLLLGVSAGLAAAATAQHETVSFDYGWRFHLGPVGSSPPAPGPPPPAPPPHGACSAEKLKAMFPVNVTVQLKGLERAHATTAEGCAAACCEMGETCFTWQYSPVQTGGGCWIGNGKPFGSKPKVTWAGGSRAGPPPPVAPPSPPPPPGDGPDILPKSSPAAAPSFDDSAWEMVDLPHDYIVQGAYSADVPGDQGPGSRPGGAGQSYLPRDLGFYRKHFALPSDWKGNAIWIRFEGVFRATKIWMNGEPVREHAGWTGDAHGEGGGVGMGGGYTSFDVRIDNATSVKYGTGDENVLSVYVDPRAGSGWFYEGGGIYRKTWLHSAPAVHLESDGIFAHGHVTTGAGGSDGADGHLDLIHRAQPTLGSTAASAEVIASAEVVNTASSATKATVQFALFDTAGKQVGTTVASSASLTAAANTSSPTTAITPTVKIAVANPELWSVARPYLYTLKVTTDSGDAKNVSIGIYSTKWTGDMGFFLNEEHVKIRGFCNHESFGGVGMAIPDRVNLFRAQGLRSVGGNGWRMSHNPVSPPLLDILDRVGVVSMDETRELHSDQISIMNMGAMVKRDRNHASVVIWSYCNEGGCGSDGAPEFRNITEKYDGTRPTLGNRFGNQEMDATTDVEGFSHKAGSVFDTYNQANPSRPKFASECCSCSSSRTGQTETIAIGNLSASATTEDSDVLSCTASQSNASNSRPFMAGTMVWTLFDYYGESHGWPKVSSAYGQFDLAGFMKNTARWYRTWWLSAVPMSDAGRPAGFGAAPSCYPYKQGGGVAVLTEAATVELYEDGTKTSTAAVLPLEAATLAVDAENSARNLTVVCLDSVGGVTASGTIIEPGEATKIELTIDAPSVLTGTGESLLLDGHDVAMLRAAVVDSDGIVNSTGAYNISFSVTSGPGRVLATHNGDNACHEPNHASWHSSYAGLARGFIQVTEHHTGSAAERARMAFIDQEAAYTSVHNDDSAPPSSITVVASSPGLASATVQIPVSTESKHGVLQAAERSVQRGAQPQRWE